MASPEVAAERLPPVTAAELSLIVVTAPLPPPVVAWLDWTFDSVDCDLPALDVALPVLDVARPVVASEGLVVVLASLPPAGAALPAPLLVVTGVGHGLLAVAFEEFVGMPVPPLGGLDAVDAAWPAGGIAALGCSVVGWLAVALAPVPDVADVPSSVFDTGCGALPEVLEGGLPLAAALVAALMDVVPGAAEPEPGAASLSVGAVEALSWPPVLAIPLGSASLTRSVLV